MLDLRRDRPLSETFALDLRPALGTFGLTEPSIIAGGAPERSVLFYRMAKLGHGRMPHVGSKVVDEEGLSLIGQWIESLAPPQISRSSPSPTTTSLQVIREIDGGRRTGDARQRAIREGMRYPDEAVRGLFERFVPEDQRPKRLGTKIDPATILAIAGDAERGSRLFFDGASLHCKSCHAVAGRGESYGPDLSRIASKLTREKILESILEPSKEIDPKFSGVIVQTNDGSVVTGILAEKSEEVVVVRDAQKAEIRLRASSVKQMAVQKTSIMPEFLLQSLTAAEAADLLAFLSSLK